MSNFSKIVVSFTRDLDLGQIFGFRASSTEPFFINLMNYEVVSIRSRPNQVQRGQSTSVAGERTAINFVAAFQLDFANTGPYSISRSGRTVTIFCTSPNIDFSNTFSRDATVTINLNPNDSPGEVITDSNGEPIDSISTGGEDNTDVTFLITNFQGLVFTIDRLSIVESVDNSNCSHYRVEVETSQLASSYSVQSVGPTIVKNNNTENPIYFEIPRGQSFTVNCFDNTGQIATRSTLRNMVPTFMTDDFEVRIVSSPNGSTITVDYTPNRSLDVQYSIDGMNWRLTNVFTGIQDGSYTIRVRNLGCIVTKQITVENATGVVTPYHHVSKSNSIRYALRSDEGDFKNDENSLSDEFYAIDPNLAYCEKQLFETQDVITTQLKSNFKEIEAKAVKKNGSYDNLQVVKRTSFIGRKDSRDAIKYNIGDNMSGVYFIGGNIYDFDTGLDTGEDYTLNGFLPEFARVGVWISINNAFYQIKSIIFDESKNADVLVIDQAHIGSETNVVVNTVFNRQKYEVFEFFLDMSQYVNETINVQIEMTHPSFETVKYISEKIYIREKHKNTVQIDYYNVSNTDILYATGIRNRIRLPIISAKAGHSDEFENIKGDSMSNIISSSVYETYVFELGLMTTGIYRKSIQALSHKFVFIDGVSFVKNASIEVEGPLEESNLFLIKPEMLKSNIPFNATGVNSVDPEFAFEENPIDVPSVIVGDNSSPIVYD